MTSKVVALSVLQPLLVSSQRTHILTACLSAHCLGLPALFLLLSCSPICLCMTIAFMAMDVPGISSSLFVSCYK